MLNIHNLSVSFQGEYLFNEVTFRLNDGDRIGLVGKTARENPQCCASFRANRNMTRARLP